MERHGLHPDTHKAGLLGLLIFDGLARPGPKSHHNVGRRFYAAKHLGYLFALSYKVRAVGVMAAMEAGAFLPDMDEIPALVWGRYLSGQRADGAVVIRMQFGLKRQ